MWDSQGRRRGRGGRRLGRSWGNKHGMFWRGDRQSSAAASVFEGKDLQKYKPVISIKNWPTSGWLDKAADSSDDLYYRSTVVFQATSSPHTLLQHQEKSMKQPENSKLFHIVMIHAELRCPMRNWLVYKDRAHRLSTLEDRTNNTGGKHTQGTRHRSHCGRNIFGIFSSNSVPCSILFTCFTHCLIAGCLSSLQQECIQFWAGPRHPFRAKAHKQRKKPQRATVTCEE